MCISSRLALGEKPQSSGRHYIALEPISESTPAKDLRNVSTFLKQPLSPEDYAPNQFPASAPSPVPLPSPAKSLIEHLQSAPVQSVVRQFREKEILESGNEIIVSLRCVSSVQLRVNVSNCPLSHAVFVQLSQYLVCYSHCRVILHSNVHYTVARL